MAHQSPKLPRRKARPKREDVAPYTRRTDPILVMPTQSFYDKAEFEAAGQVLKPAIGRLFKYDQVYIERRDGKAFYVPRSHGSSVMQREGRYGRVDDKSLLYAAGAEVMDKIFYKDDSWWFIFSYYFPHEEGVFVHKVKRAQLQLAVDGDGKQVVVIDVTFDDKW